MNILIIEDEANQRKLLRKVLSKEGYAVSEAGSGEEGTNLFFKDNFDLVLLDRKLTDKDGIEVLRDIKKINPLVPVIIITAFANVSNAVEATSGQIVTYNGESVLTPYFNQSDGRTRSISEVWGYNQLDYPWLVGKNDPYCQGMSLNGHGVGLSTNKLVEIRSNQVIFHAKHTGLDLA